MMVVFMPSTSTVIVGGDVGCGSVADPANKVTATTVVTTDHEHPV